MASFVWKEKYIKGHDVNPTKKQWLKYTHVGILFIWASYFIFLLGDFVPYILGPITYSIAIYALSFWAIAHKAIAKEDVKYQNSSLNHEQSHEIFKSLETYFNRDKVFLDPNLKLSAVAKQLNVTPHALSQVVNENYNHNFQYYLNSFRIEEAKLKLASETSKNVTISSIAYDCGFNSISAFNTAFKKLENQTPSQFRGMNRS